MALRFRFVFLFFPFVYLDMFRNAIPLLCLNFPLSLVRMSYLSFPGFHFSIQRALTHHTGDDH